MAYICMQCGEKFARMNDYNFHMETVGWDGKCKMKNSPEFIEKINKAYDEEFYKSPQWEKKLMTREEAMRIAGNTQIGSSAKSILEMLEALGVLKFSDEPKHSPLPIVELAQNGDIINRLYDEGKHLLKKYGAIRLEEWPEGLVLWIGGEIKLKSWEKYYKKGDIVTINCDDCTALGITRNGSII